LQELTYVLGIEGHYVVANQREFNPPKILVMLAKYYKKVMNIPTNNV
jgi:hypothetical protein